MRRCVCDSDQSGVLVGDEVGVGKTLSFVVVAMICKLLTEKVVMGMPL